MRLGGWGRLRIALVGCGLLAGGVAVAHRAFSLQVLQAEQLRGWADRHAMKEIEVPARRGRILDRNGAELASSIELDSVYCNPRLLAGVPGAAAALAGALRLTEAKVAADLAAKRQQAFLWLKRRVPPEESAAALALGLPGVGTRKEARRVYPGAELAATVVGHVGVDGRGLDGVELSFDAHLRGTSTQITGLRDALGREVLLSGWEEPADSAGKDVMLALDRYLTFVTEKILASAAAEHQAKGGVAVVQDPRTGEILAMASVPTYDPHDPAAASRHGARNRAITDVFEPGSTMKTFTFAAALDAGRLRPDELVDCENGRIKVGRYTIRDDHPQKVITAAEVFKKSSNVGTLKIARRVGRDALYETLRAFGFGAPTGIELPGERRGTLRPPATWGEIGLATVAFGQGMTATALQLTTAFSAIATGGVYRAPRIGKRIVGADGAVTAAGPDAAPGERRVIGERAARVLLDVMREVTEKGGTAERAAIDGYPVAGKTGTAQKAGGGRYEEGRYVASFVGIVPADAPRLTIAVIIDEPHPVHYGGVVAAPAFRQIAEAALRYLGVPPSRPLAGASPPAPASLERDGGDLAAERTADLAIGDSTDLLDGEPAGDAAEISDDLVPVPDLTGMSIGEAIRTARRAGVVVDPTGSGVAGEQTPREGFMPRGTILRVSFRPRG